MEARKRELQELAQRQRFRPSDEVATFKIIKSVKEAVAFAHSIGAAAKSEVLVASPEDFMAVASLFGLIDLVGEIVGRRARFRTLTDVSFGAIEVIEKALAVGEDVRHMEGYEWVYFCVLDRRMCFHAINLDLKRVSLNEPLVMLYTDDPTYADYLVATFEILWEQSIPAAERIQELQRQGPPQV